MMITIWYKLYRIKEDKTREKLAECDCVRKLKQIIKGHIEDDNMALESLRVVRHKYITEEYDADWFVVIDEKQKDGG